MTRHALFVRLRERDTGRLFSFVNTHLIPNAVHNGKPRPGRPRLFAAYRNSVINLGRLVKEERDFGQVYVMGDFNIGFVQDRRAHRYHLPYATFRRLGMPSMWATQRPRHHQGTQINGTKLIDQIYGPRRATSAHVRTDIRYGDHYPVIARYVVPATPIETPTPTTP